MTFDISLVQWPANSDDSAKLIVSCILSAMERLDVEFGVEIHDALDLAKRYARGGAADEDIRSARASLWDVINNRDGVTNFQDADLLRARLALCILPPVATDPASLEEKLEFFLEVLRRLKLPTEDAVAAIIGQLTPYLSAT